MSKSFYKELGVRVKNRRERLGMSQNDLAEEAKVSQSLVSRVEAGVQTSLRIDDLFSLSSGLDCAPSRLLKGLI